MELTTKVEINKRDLPAVSHKDRILMLGSCFTDNIGNRMLNAGFNVTVNPYGALYNPISILNSLTSDTTEFRQWAQQLPSDEIDINMYNLYILTFGTSWIYRLKSTGHIVANCKKQPDKIFTRERITINDIIDIYIGFIEEIVIPKRQKVIFTVSPIRHKRDGLHDNQLSKATLLLAVDQMCTRYPKHCYYFPSYEIMLDELRDYRFYADDMLHPSPLAVDYIWQRFRETCCIKATAELAERFEKLNRTLRHRPSDADNPEYIRLIETTKKQIKQLKDAIQD